MANLESEFVILFRIEVLSVLLLLLERQVDLLVTASAKQRHRRDLKHNKETAALQTITSTAKLKKYRSCYFLHKTHVRVAPSGKDRRMDISMSSV